MESVTLSSSSFRDPRLSKKLISAIKKVELRRDVNLMEVCGTHTVSIARCGIKSVLPKNIHLISGPGCPVCVTANEDIDKIIALARIKDVIITTFGDMLRVPGSTSSLSAVMAKGSDVRIVYSPIDALNIAKENKNKQVVLIGVGFETTTPLVACAIKHAKSMNLRNFSVFVAHKNMPGAIEAIVNDDEVKIDGLILPGHVSVVIGTKPYLFLAEKYGMPGVVSGFEAVDILQAIYMLVMQISKGDAKIENAYSRAVTTQGNVNAKSVISEVFETCDSNWRGLGVIAKSGYRIKKDFAEFDASRRFSFTAEPTIEQKGCKCSDVIRGAISPCECPLFRKVCTPENPVGPCMVSSEGACSAHYRYY